MPSGLTKARSQNQDFCAPAGPVAGSIGTDLPGLVLTLLARLGPSHTLTSCRLIEVKQTRYARQELFRV